MLLLTDKKIRVNLGHPLHPQEASQGRECIGIAQGVLACYTHSMGSASVTREWPVAAGVTQEKIHSLKWTCKMNIPIL